MNTRRQLRKQKEAQTSWRAKVEDEIEFQTENKNEKRIEKVIAEINEELLRGLVKLDDAYVPQEFKFRDEERQQLQSHLELSYEQRGSQQCLYITGMPGLGKTACLMQVLNQFQKQHKETTQLIYINALQLKTSQWFYNTLWAKLGNNMISSSKKANGFLDEYFKSQQVPWKTNKKGSEVYEQNKIKILVVDEIDFLISRSQNVLYNLFDWQHYPNAGLIIIAIANTLNFPEKIQQKIQSRMGVKSLIFKPYLAAQIQSIIEQWLQDCNYFQKNALQYLSCKIASYSSDIRKALHLSWLCYQQAQQDLDCQKTAEGIKNKIMINIDWVDAILKEEFEKPIVQFVQQCNEITKIFLIALVFEFHNKNNKILDQAILFKKFNSLLKTILNASINQLQFDQLLAKIHQCRVIDFIDNAKERKKIIFLVESEDIVFGMKDDKFFKTHGHLNFLLKQ